MPHGAVPSRPRDHPSAARRYETMPSPDGHFSDSYRHFEDTLGLFAQSNETCAPPVGRRAPETILCTPAAVARSIGHGSRAQSTDECEPPAADRAEVDNRFSDAFHTRKILGATRAPAQPWRVSLDRLRKSLINTCVGTFMPRARPTTTCNVAR
jgi:hypothetical protein